MSPEQFRLALDRLRLSQGAAARLFGTHPRTAQRWASGDQDIPAAVAIALQLMMDHDEDPQDWMPEDDPTGPAG